MSRAPVYVPRRPMAGEIEAVSFIRFFLKPPAPVASLENALELYQVALLTPRLLNKAAVELAALGMSLRAIKRTHAAGIALIPWVKVLEVMAVRLGEHQSTVWQYLETFNGRANYA